MPRTSYITVLPYYRYSLKTHTMHDIRRNTQGHLAHSLAFFRGTRVIVISPFAHPDSTVANLSGSVSIEFPYASEDGLS